MKLNAYLSPSRHGIYYFRWPLPTPASGKRASVKISLRTRCPDRAGDIARYLASCGRLIRDSSDLSRLRQDEIRELVRNYFQDSHKRYLERLNDSGLSDRALTGMKEELEIHEATKVGCDDFSDQILDDLIPSFRKSTSLSNEQWSENAANLKRELRNGRQDLLRAVLKAAKSLESYSFDHELNQRHEPPQPASAPLGAAIADFLAEHSKEWPTKTTLQIRAYLNVLLEFFGPDQLLGNISRQDASAVKNILMALPASRNTKPALKDLQLREVIKVSGHKTISPKTINSHIDTFRRFFDWAERHGHTPNKLFEGMKVPKAKNAATERKPFSKEQTQLIYKELTENTSGLVRSESHKWGSLIGLFTGARLNEICQLEVADIKEEGGLWFLDITDEGDNKKRIKAIASRRKVPVHSELLRLGFLEFVNSRSSCKRLFPDYSYNTNGGYGRNLGRWFNETTFLPKLGLKKPGVVFHCLRHTMVTRLGRAGVPEPIFQCIVGHAREGVTQEVYLREGYTLTQLKDAIDKFNA